MKRKKELTMLEYLDDNNQWSWFAVYEKKTPKQAVKDFVEEMGIKFREKDVAKDTDVDGVLHEDGECRAYRITLE